MENDVVFVLAQCDPRDPNTWEDQKYFGLFGFNNDKQNMMNKGDDLLSNTDNKIT